MQLFCEYIVFLIFFGHIAGPMNGAMLRSPSLSVF